MGTQGQRPSTALVLETNNLQGGQADADRIVASLTRLLRHLRNQGRPLRSLADLVVTHDGLPPSAEGLLREASGVSHLRLVELPPGTDYYQAKNLGFLATGADVVAFADSDCWPKDVWLEELLRPFENDPGTQVVAGRTTYRGDLLGTAATTIDFKYYPSPLGPDCTRNFYANNVAFRREVFAQRGFPARSEIYRGPCQMLGLQLQREGVQVRFVPRARTIHRLPDSTRELLSLRLMRGQDLAELTPSLFDAYVPRGLRWLGRLGPLSAAAVLSMRLGYGLSALERQDMPSLGNLRRLEAVGVIAGISLLDTVGAMGRATGILGSRGRGGAHANAALSYHGDADRLAA